MSTATVEYDWTSTVHLQTTWGEKGLTESDVARVFGMLVRYATEHLERYHSDLFHDAIFLHNLWMESDCQRIVFWWSVDDCGTFITSNKDLAYLSGTRDGAAKYVEMLHDQRHDVCSVSFTDITVK